jgi:putative ABC transport system permease protein
VVDLATKSLLHDKLDYREILGRRLKIIGRAVDAKSFTTTPLTFMDYRLAQSLNPSELRGNTT